MICRRATIFCLTQCWNAVENKFWQRSHKFAWTILLALVIIFAIPERESIADELTRSGVPCACHRRKQKHDINSLAANESPLLVSFGQTRQHSILCRYANDGSVFSFVYPAG